MRPVRRKILLGTAAILVTFLAIGPDADARGGGGRGGKGGGKRGGMGSAQGRGDYLQDLQDEESGERAAEFRDDATREPLRDLRVADRVGAEPVR